MEAIEYRKLQETRSGSYMVSIPKDWALQLGLRKGSLLTVTRRGGESLVIEPKEVEEVEKPQIAFVELGESLARDIIGKYLLGYDIIKIHFKRREPKLREHVRGVIRKLVGVEIVEEGGNEIVLQCLLAPTTLSVKGLLRRSYLIVDKMHLDAMDSLINKDVDLARDVEERDDDVDRLYFLLIRQLRAALQNPRIAKKIGVNPIECIDYRLMASHIESIGDLAVDISRRALMLKDLDLSKEMADGLKLMSDAARSIHGRAVEAFFKHDTGEAEGVIKKTLEVNKVAEKLNIELLKLPSPIATNLSLIVFNLQRIAGNGADIADLVIKP